MAKLFRGAFWVSMASFFAKTADEINRHPRFMRSAILVFLNLAGFVCFWVLFYGLGLYLVPEPGHPDYKLMRFGVQFMTFVISLLLSIGLYNLVRGIVAIGKGISDFSQGLKVGGTVVVKIPEKVVDAARQTADGTVKLVKNTGSGAARMVKTGIRKGSEAVKVTADWSKENVPKAVKGVKGFTAATFRKVNSIFKKKKGIGC